MKINVKIDKMLRNGTDSTETYLA